MDGSPKKCGWKTGLAAVLAVAAAVMLAVGMVGCATTRQLSVDYGTSNLYSTAEMDDAIDVVKADFAKLAGCELYSLRFAGDERCKAELDEANRGRAQEERYTACIVFDSVFRSPLAGGAAWEASTRYYWSWIVAKTATGAWIVINRGYA